MASEKPEDKDLIKVINRSEWKAEPPVSPKPMDLPVKHVFYTETETVEYKTKEHCSEIVKGIQKFHMDYRGLSDIQYHFLIGGDGNVFEGRSWFTSGMDYPKTNCQITSEMNGKSIEVAFIGSYKDKEPSKEMKVAANSLIHYGITNKLLDDSVVGEKESNDTNKLKYSNTDSTITDDSEPEITKSDSTVTDCSEKKNYASNN